MEMDLLKMTAVELAGKIKAGEVTVMEAVQAVLNRIDAVDAVYRCYITVDRDGAMKKAEDVQRRIESGELCGILAGVPVAIKDNLCTKGMLTTCASKMLGNFIPTYSAEAVLRLEEAGMVVVGKTNMDEFAMGSTTETSAYGQTRNPWDIERVPGGSSGGSAAAAAAGECFAALGSDTGGSIGFLRSSGDEAYLWNGVPVRTDCLWFFSGSDRPDWKGRNGLRGNAGSNRFL